MKKRTRNERKSERNRNRKKKKRDGGTVGGNELGRKGREKSGGQERVKRGAWILGKENYDAFLSIL